MTEVPTPRELERRNFYANPPTLSNGSAHALPMSDAEKKAAAERDRPPFGFRAEDGGEE